MRWPTRRPRAILRVLSTPWAVPRTRLRRADASCCCGTRRRWPRADAARGQLAFLTRRYSSPVRRALRGCWPARRCCARSTWTSTPPMMRSLRCCARPPQPSSRVTRRCAPARSPAWRSLSVPTLPLRGPPARRLSRSRAYPAIRPRWPRPWVLPTICCGGHRDRPTRPPEHGEKGWERGLGGLVARPRLSVAHACALVLIAAAHGARDQARGRFEELATPGLASLRPDMVYVWALALLARACVELGASHHAQPIYRALAPYAGRVAVAAGAVMCAGSVDRYLAGLAPQSRPPDPADGPFPPPAAHPPPL